MSDFSRALIPMGDLTNVAGAGTPGAAVNWFTTALVVPSQCFRITITVAVSIASIVKYARNANTLVSLSNGNPLTAGAAQTFTIACRPGDTFQMQDSAGAAVQELQVEGFHGGI